MRVKIEIYRKKRGVLPDKRAEKAIRDCIRAVLKAEEFPHPAEISVNLTDDEGIRELNRAHRGIDRATDVLSFPMAEYENGKPSGDSSGLFFAEESVFLGDVVISVERARAQAEEYGHGFFRELGFLTAHSALHLLGYDHERNDADAALMRFREEQVLSSLGLER